MNLRAPVSEIAADAGEGIFRQILVNVAVLRASLPKSGCEMPGQEQGRR